MEDIWHVVFVVVVVAVVVSLAPFQFSLSLCGKELGMRKSRP